jgi:hypothetical protein
VASLEAWANDPAWRQFADLLIKVPGSLQDRVIPYLGLFRQGERGLTPVRAARVLQQLVGILEPGTIRWEGGEERPCPHHVWAEALDATLQRRPKGLKNHNYLRHVAWEMAAPHAAKAERDRERSLAGREHVQPAEPQMTDEEKAALDAQFKAFWERFGR